ncbi:MAG TPA: type I-U CRISPR-associated RAMP protein Csb1/Cas7u [Gaiellaceae bacterium]|jgi:CRISPR-associated protein Csb1|nr:type I-U CRISPR-associated RAMP protein Csb1/Cas7u [Gaiellaceae bacterium]
MTDLASLLGEPRLKLVAKLEPIAGTRFQPTGFPDLGPATYPSPVDGRRLLLVESAQSMANRLESRLWDVTNKEPIDLARGLPYVRVFDNGGEYLTSSRTESHRLASAYVKAAAFDGTTGLELIGERLGLAKQRPIDHARVARAVFDLDPLCLLHGVFFADEKWPGQPKVARAVTAFVEAAGVQEAYSGGVKFDHVSNKGDKDVDKRTAKEGFGNVPFARTEFVAESIAASFVIDLSQIRRYALEDRERELLLALALFEIRSLLHDGLRLRTACDLLVESIELERPKAFELPDLGSLEQEIRERIAEQSPPLDGVYGG